MEKRRRRERIGFLLAAAFFIAAGLFFSYTCTLKHPVFLRMDWEVRLQEMESEKELQAEFWLHYIQDRDDKSQISEIRFPELEEAGGKFLLNGDGYTGFYFGGNGFRTEDSQREKYELHEIAGRFYVPKEAVSGEGLTLTRMLVKDQDGREDEVEIGSIHLECFSNHGFFQMESGFSSSDGTSGEEYQVMKDCRLEEIQVHNPEKIREEYTIRINDAVDLWDWKPTDLKKGDRITIDAKWHGREELAEPMNRFLRWQCSAGEEEGCAMVTELHRPFYSGWADQRELFSYLRERGAFRE
ncbi:MAG: hypothetical protein Q4F29_09415 [Lachnospiraceae bacterium]|nr:hypothetical protein [Lachnospiraceae bacterium]